MSKTTSLTEVTATSTHSPGPWVAAQGMVDGEPQMWWDIQVARGNAMYSYMQNLAMVLDSDDKAEANATLMAAAPDLLAALKGLIATDGSGVYATINVITAGRAAIAKAEGRPAS